MMTVLTRDVRRAGVVGGNGDAPSTEFVPSIVLVLAGIEYGPVPLDQVGDPPLTVTQLAGLGDTDLKQAVADHFDLPYADLSKHVVTRPSTGNVIITEPTVLG